MSIPTFFTFVINCEKNKCNGSVDLVLNEIAAYCWNPADRGVKLRS